jgi:hypothetical protein
MSSVCGRASLNVGGRTSLNVAIKGVTGTVFHFVELVSSFQSKKVIIQRLRFTYEY